MVMEFVLDIVIVDVAVGIVVVVVVVVAEDTCNDRSDLIITPFPLLVAIILLDNIILFPIFSCAVLL